MDDGSQMQQRTHRLFGAHMNSVVTYQDANTAWLVTEDFLSRMSSAMYARFAGGGHFAGVKLVRGYSDLSAKAETKDGKESESATDKDGQVPKEGQKSRDEPEDAEKNPSGNDRDSMDPASPSSPVEERKLNLERQVSSLAESDPAKREEEIRRRDEQEIRDDYKDHEGEDQDREIEHLILVTHGIGQRLGFRMESINFVHDVNTFRKTLKSVYASSPDLQALNSEVDKMPKNSRVQVLPICWRHLLDFPKQSLKHNRREFDLGKIDTS